MGRAKTKGVLSSEVVSDMEKAALKQLIAEDFVERIWNKDPSLWKKSSEEQAVIKDALGWLTVPTLMNTKLTELRDFTGEVRCAGLKHVVVLGMGGSSLAPLVFAESFDTPKDYPTLHILDSTDPRKIRELTSKLDIANTLFIVASKSGSTIEPLSFFEYFRALVEDIKGEAYGENFIAITDAGSSLEKLAKGSGFRRVFLNPHDIGGRYSALSYFGLVPAVLSGIDVERLLSSAATMVRALGAQVGAGDNHAILLGLSLGVLAEEGRDKVTFFISDKISTFGLWIEQLLAESTGKEGHGLVPIVDEPIADIKDYGDDRVFVFIRLDDSPIEGPDIDALRTAGHPVIELHMECEYSLGSEFFMWEFATAIAGRVLGINPFDQPNVESAKNSTRELLGKIEKGGDIGGAPAFASSDNFDLYVSGGTQKALGLKEGIDAETVLSAVFREDADYSAILAYLDPSDEGIYEELQSMRKVFTGEGTAAHFGYGPRYLHSTGQLHKGGVDGGVFVVITNGRGGGVDDLAIPGKGYSFGELEFSQAMGDAAALDVSGRRVVLIDIKDNVSVSAALRELTALFKKII